MTSIPLVPIQSQTRVIFSRADSRIIDQFVSWISPSPDQYSQCTSTSSETGNQYSRNAIACLLTHKQATTTTTSLKLLLSALRQDQHDRDNLPVGVATHAIDYVNSESLLHGRASLEVGRAPSPLRKLANNEHNQP